MCGHIWPCYFQLFTWPYGIHPIGWLAALDKGWLVIIDIVFALATAAAVSAWITITQAKRQAREAQRALLAERRIDFQLGLLAEMADENIKGDAGWSRGFLSVRAAMLPVDLAPKTRAAYGLQSTETAQAEIDAMTRSGRPMYEFSRDLVKEELITAVSTLLSARSIRAVSGHAAEGEEQRSPRS